jgi:peptidoglycan/LPS O-acetylase OafA/YrhL
MTFLKDKDSIKHNNNFNFLRLLLAVLVLLSHSPELMDGNTRREILTNIFHTISFSELAVDGFFLLSGYLILQSWQRTPELISFLKKRILRIYPGFICATIICAFFVAPIGASSLNYFSEFNTLKFLKGMLLLDTPVIPPVFVNQYYPVVNGSMWTIAYEFRCYLFVAIFGIISTIQRSKVWLILAVAFISIAIDPVLSTKIYVRSLSYLFGNPKELIHFLSFFCAGGCFYLFKDRIHYTKTRICIAVSITVLSLFEIHLLHIILPTMGAYIFFLFSFLNLPALQKFGSYSDISYGTYLYGWPTQKLLIWYFPQISPWLLFISACGISGGLGLLSWHLIEKPFLSMKIPKHKTI